MKATPPRQGEAQYSVMIVTFAKDVARRLSAQTSPKVHEELAVELKARLMWQPTAPAPAPPRNPARATTAEYAGPNRTPRTMTFDANGDLEAIPAAPAPGLLAPTTVMLRMPFHPQQSLITVRTSHVPALMALDAQMAISELHLVPRGLTPFDNIGAVVDLVDALRHPREQLENWRPDEDGALIAAVRRRMDSRLHLNWAEIGGEVGREETVCEQRWRIIQRMPPARTVEPRRVAADAADGPTQPSAWTPAEDEALRSAVTRAFEGWDMVATWIDDRDAAACEARWMTMH